MKYNKRTVFLTFLKTEIITNLLVVNQSIQTPETYFLKNSYKIGYTTESDHRKRKQNDTNNVTDLHHQ